MILAMVVSMAAFSLSMFMDLWRDERYAGVAAVEEYRLASLLRSSLEGTYDYYVTDPANERKKNYYPFFSGKSDSLIYVTLSSVFNKGSAALARITFKKENETDEAKLIYEETLLDSTYVRYQDQLPEFTHRLVISDSATDIQFRYFGLWERIWQPALEDFLETERWQEAFLGKEKRMLPGKIEMTLSASEGKEVFLFTIRSKNVFKQDSFSSGD